MVGKCLSHGRLIDAVPGRPCNPAAAFCGPNLHYIANRWFITPWFFDASSDTELSRMCLLTAGIRVSRLSNSQAVVLDAWMMTGEATVDPVQADRSALGDKDRDNYKR